MSPARRRPSYGPIITAAAALALLSFPATAGFDARKANILTLRLGMTEAEVMGALVAQGVVASRVEREHQPCPQMPEAGCLVRLKARTRDGWLTVSFAPPRPNDPVERVGIIAYALDGRGPNEPALIRESVINHFGPPTVWKPMTWCQRPDAGGGCPAGRPRMTFGAGAGTSVILTLSAGDTS